MNSYSLMRGTLAATAAVLLTACNMDVINPAVQATMQDVGKSDPAPISGTTTEAAVK